MGNLLGGFLGDRVGGKSVFLAAYVSLAAVAVVAIVASSEWAFLVMFVLFGMGFTLNMVGRQTLALELAAPDRLPTYMAMMLSGVAPFMLLSASAATVAKAASEAVDNAFWPICLPCIVGLAAATFFMLRVREPRGS